MEAIHLHLHPTVYHQLRMTNVAFLHIPKSKKVGPAQFPPGQTLALFCGRSKMKPISAAIIDVRLFRRWALAESYLVPYKNRPNKLFLQLFIKIGENP